MRIRLVFLVCLLVLAACDSGEDVVGSTSSTSTTTTTIDNDTCERVASDTVRYLDDLIDTLDETRLREFVDTEQWPQDLRDLQRAGKDLDLRIGALRCDAVAIQQYAFAEADLDANGPLSEELLRLLLQPEPLEIPDTTTTTSTTTPPVESTSSTDAP